MGAEIAKVRLAAVLDDLGREIRVFNVPRDSANSDQTSATSTSQDEEPDDFYDLTPEDYYRLIGNKLGEQFLKTRKIREAETAARRAKITKAVIRVRFPDGYVLQAKFHPSETIQCLVDLLTKVVARKDLPFYIYTTPPKQRIKDTSKDFYSAGFAPGAIVYFSYDLPEGSETALVEPFLREDIMALKDELTLGEKSSTGPSQEAPIVATETAATAPQQKPASQSAAKAKAKPKWFKM